MHEKLPRPQDISVGVVTIGEQKHHVKMSDAVIQYEKRYEAYDHVLILPENENDKPVRYFPEDHQEIYDWIREGIKLVVSCEPTEDAKQAYSEQALAPEGIEVSVEDMMSGIGDLLGSS